MSPGPLFAANIFYGIKGGIKAGIKMAIGHTVVELPLIILLGIGVFSLETFPEFRTYLQLLEQSDFLYLQEFKLKQHFK